MFGRKKRKVPEWAAVLNEENYQYFMSVVEDHFNRRGEPYTIEDGVVQIDENLLSLDNLIRQCAQGDPSEYQALVEGHFASMDEGHAFSESLDTTDFEAVRQYVGTRLFPEEFAKAGDGESTVNYHFAGSVYAVLIYDFPQVLQAIQPEEIDAWGKTKDELFALGIENIRKNYPLEPKRVNLDEEDYLLCVEEDHHFATNILFELEKHEEFIGKGGAIIATPNRHMAMIYPIRSAKVINALTTFFTAVPGFCDEYPGSMTREVFWYHDGQYEPLNYSIGKGKKVSFFPSEEFLAMMEDGLEPA